MIELRQIRALFDELVDLAPVEQRRRIEQLRSENTQLANELEALLEIERTDAKALTKAAKQALVTAMNQPESLVVAGSAMDRYTLLAEIGRGGMGVVFKAVRREGEFRHIVALKTLRQGLLDQKSIDRFLRERTLLASLQHPNICRFIDSGTDKDGTPFVVMELIEGLDLLSYARQANLGVEQRVRLFQQVLLGVAHAHRSLVVHRDLKPTNIIVDEHGTPKLLDFGIAHTIEPDRVETERWFTAQYGAPEQLLGQRLTTSCDIYSLGVILFELLANKSPFELTNKSPSEVEKQVVGTPAPLMHLGATRKYARWWQNGRLNELDCITQKALRKEPSARYLSADEFWQDLQSWLNGMPIAAKGNHFAYQLKKFLQRNRLMAGASAVILVILTLSIVQIAQKSAAASAARLRAELALSIMTDAFVAADPLQATKGQVSVRDVLKASSKRLRNLGTAHSEDLVQVGLKIAAVQSRLGLAKDSQLLASTAYTQAILVADEESRVELNRLRIRAAITLGELAQAKQMLEQENNSQARNHPEFLLLQSDVLTYADSDVQEKERLLQSSIRLFELDPTHPAAILARLKLAELNFSVGRKDQAMLIANQVFEKYGRSLGEMHPEVVRATFYRLNLQRRIKISPELVTEALALLPKVEQVFGKDSSVLAATHALLASIYRSLEQMEQAAVNSRAAYTLYENTLGASHESTLREHLNLALTLKRLPDRQAETIEMYRSLLTPLLSSEIVDSAFRHYALASAALYFRSVGLHQLALETISHPSYKPDTSVWSAEQRADFANDLFLIANDAGCLMLANSPAQLCYSNSAVTSQCLPATKRYCELTQKTER